MLRIGKVLLLFSLNRQADRSENGYELLQYMNCKKPIDGIDKKFAVCVLAEVLHME